jgi:uncharacterized protein YktA (UPF0223 family)
MTTVKNKHLERMNEIVYGRHWTPEAIRDFKHFSAIVKHWQKDVTEDELKEAYRMLKGVEPEETKPSKPQKK